jgi:hypothetical protein
MKRRRLSGGVFCFWWRGALACRSRDAREVEDWRQTFVVADRLGRRSLRRKELQRQEKLKI